MSQGSIVVHGGIDKSVSVVDILYHPSWCFLVRVSKKSFDSLPLTILFPFLFSRIEEEQEAPQRTTKELRAHKIVEHESSVHSMPVLRKTVQDEQKFNHAHEVRLRRPDELRVSHLLGHIREEYQIAQTLVAKTPYLHPAKVFRPQKNILETSSTRAWKFFFYFLSLFDENIRSSTIRFLRFDFWIFDNVSSLFDEDIVRPNMVFMIFMIWFLNFWQCSF